MQHSHLAYVVWFTSVRGNGAEWYGFVKSHAIMPSLACALLKGRQSTSTPRHFKMSPIVVDEHY